MTRYSAGFYRHQQDGSLRSGNAIVPLVQELLQPGSVVDVGCGVGTWLAVFRRLGVEDVLGIDGPYVDRGMLHVEPDRFLARDLSQHFDLGRRFDLALSMEVAEHLPGSAADVFVDNLVRLSPFVLFSAAVPYQGGTDHRNEQWPGYWVQRFEARDYVAIDCLRRRIWNNPDVNWHYAQNTLLFAERAHVERHPVLRSAYEETDRDMLSIVHPHALDRMRFKSAVKVLGAATRRAVCRRLGLTVGRPGDD